LQRRRGIGRIHSITVDFSNLYLVLKSSANAGPFGSLAEAKAAGAVTISYGVFLNQVVSFLIVAFAVFILIRGMNKLKFEKEPLPAEPTTKECPECFSVISIKAKRCPECTSILPV
jgi:large conductance mechanosensitive channel